MSDELDRLKADNAKLRDELAKWERLTDCIDLPEYPVSQFAPKDLERENAALRELARDLYRCVANIGNYDVFYYAPSEPGCGMDCVVNGEGCCLRTFERRVRDLGVEADG